MQIQEILQIAGESFDTIIPMFLGVLFVNIIFNTILFIFASFKKDNSIIDIFYSWLFMLPIFILSILPLLIFYLFKNSSDLFYFSQFLEEYASLKNILAILIFIWGIRLSLRIYKKNKNKAEDFRYAAWRNLWLKKGLLYFYTRSYFQIFFLQAFIASIIVLPTVYGLLFYTTGTILNFHTLMLFGFGLLLWTIGFIFESVGDRQLDDFLKDKERLEKEKIMTTGLWKYTRHPNYFGEIMMWWSIWIMTGLLPFLIISPLLITYLLKYVSGVPMLENRWDNHPDLETKNKWLEYKNKTPAIFPSIKNIVKDIFKK
jgi:steroid 5-alpha reductase family enzyme